MKDIFLKLIFNILKKLHEPHNDLPFLPERIKLVTSLHDIRLNMLAHKKFKASIKSRINFEKSS